MALPRPPSNREIADVLERVADRAHELGRTGDWVALFYERNGDEGQCTVVSENDGPLVGRRVVRGREAECAKLATGDASAPAARRRGEGAADA